MSAKDTEIKKHVRDRYARAARTGASCCGAVSNPCCGGESELTRDHAGRLIGYSAEDLAAIPGEANLGLGCGNPSALASLKLGETILDLGSGAGIDCFLAARQVGPSGLVIGVDMTPEMIERARRNARESGFSQVEFRLGEIENLPVADSSVDVILSNCVINLSTDKPRVFREAYRVLRPGGRMLVSDLVLRRPLPQALRGSIEAYVACIAGALPKDEYLGIIRKAGFRSVKVIGEKAFPPELVLDGSPAPRVGKQLNLAPEELMEHISSVLSLNVSAAKPAR